MTVIKNSSRFSLYEADMLKLLGSLTIKCHQIALNMNTYLLEEMYTVGDNPNTWKYYKHIAGEYHESDELMTIVSMDTLETIEFNKAVLKEHKSTQREYRYGSPYYNALVARFPKQENLIKGILNPIDIETAISAEDGTILRYDNRFVEKAETNLIPMLQSRINNYFKRRNNTAYNETDDLFLTAWLSGLYSKIIGWVINIRLSNIFTGNVHSFHIWARLASYGAMDKHREYLTDKQKLYLYRNIDWLMDEAGKNSTFDILVDKFMTDRALPTYTYNMRHNLAPLVSEDNKSIYPEIALVKEALNYPIARVTSGTTDTIEEMLYKQSSLARDNLENLQDDVVSITKRMQHSAADSLPTKVVEVGLVDTTDTKEYTLGSITLNQWLYMATTERYYGFIHVPNPYSGEVMQLNPRNSFIVYTYLSLKSRGYDVIDEVIPDLPAYHVIRNRLPNFSQLRKLALKSNVSDQLIDAFLEETVVPAQIINAQDFNHTCRRILGITSWHIKQRQLVHSEYAKNDIQQVGEAFYHDIMCKLSPEKQTFREVLDALGLEFTYLAPTDAASLANSVASESVGFDSETSTTLSGMQHAMVDIIQCLTNHDVQFLKSSTGGGGKSLGWSIPRCVGHEMSLTLHQDNQPVDMTISIKRASVQVLSQSKGLTDVTVTPKVHYKGRASGRLYMDNYYVRQSTSTLTKGSVNLQQTSKHVELL